ncbi:DNA recombination protein RmuC [Sinimarinibacterium sp. CAU 1509]|uniref:DNA recombination protein RmuC n=1 Tax=Sinimarinibacterium sp. CAU 1509 TaxID=2562283 RepID=UPI0010ABE139|nr:DNA recombination protein RmuC [Sinimarinibacterium sp. CAU 1509]TJY58849.1 DNA recombination protein RmuC [Sinimarinibacterium sp. CAU 1509]
MTLPFALSTLIIFVVAFAGAWLGAWLTQRHRGSDTSATDALLERQTRLETLLREEGAAGRRESAESARAQRAELAEQLKNVAQQMLGQQDVMRKTLGERLDAFAVELRAQTQQLAEGQRQFIEDARAGRKEQHDALARFAEGQTQQATALRSSVEEGLKTLRQENTEKLEQMRKTVDEKLHDTLEKRLGESFKLVSDRLEQVHKGLGEMQSLASGVGDLKRVLTNVKSRGIFGEVQLAALLEQVLTIEQYAANVATKPGSDARVEFAIKLPGRSDDGEPVWLPIDAKFPREDYERLIEAQERADPVGAEAAALALEKRIRAEAQTIAEKYLSPPHTTDFGILFVPTEGLYAEILRRPGLFEDLQRKHRVTVTGPTNLLAFLNSLQMGFRTLTIEKRSSEVWQVLGAVKTEFGKFGDVLDKVRKKLDEATNQLDATGVRTRAISRRLKTVQELPGNEAEKLLGSGEDGIDDAS